MYASHRQQAVKPLRDRHLGGITSSSPLSSCMLLQLPQKDQQVRLDGVGAE